MDTKKRQTDNIAWRTLDLSDYNTAVHVESMVSQPKVDRFEEEALFKKSGSKATRRPKNPSPRSSSEEEDLDESMEEDIAWRTLDLSDYNTGVHVQSMVSQPKVDRFEEEALFKKRYRHIVSFKEEAKKSAPRKPVAAKEPAKGKNPSPRSSSRDEDSDESMEEIVESLGKPILFYSHFPLFCVLQRALYLV
uniref:Protein TSSC4 n=1 Tax=Caenorhabditis tropicalis TaxID=1561998 RepID=A0A1I7TEA0_9PELO